MTAPQPGSRAWRAAPVTIRRGWLLLTGLDLLLVGALLGKAIG